MEVIRRLLAGDDSGFEGEQFSLVPGARLRYEVLRTEVPLLIGTWGVHLAAYAGEVAAELKIGGTANPDLVPLMRSRIGNDRVRIVVGAVTVVDEDAKPHGSGLARKQRCTSRSSRVSTQPSTFRPAWSRTSGDWSMLGSARRRGG